MAQGARTSSFTMNELGMIAFGPIPALADGTGGERSLLTGPSPHQSEDMGLYIDDLNSAHDS